MLDQQVQAAGWLRVWTDLGRAPRTIDAYARGLAEYLETCEWDIDPLTASRAHIGIYVRKLTERSCRPSANMPSLFRAPGWSTPPLRSGCRPCGCSTTTSWRRGLRESNPIGRCRFTPGHRDSGHQPGLVSRLTKLPWIPTGAAAGGHADRRRRRACPDGVMPALAYDAALGTDDLNPAHRPLRISAETTTNRLERVVPSSAPTGVLLSDYLAWKLNCIARCGNQRRRRSRKTGQPDGR
ncbi:hypothetical protein R1X32_11110 (plasmid) [Rhodococcus opacus]|uniref:hypothetical protein n=1 Tax=Rhodococcus opacus TaxID=37919 RepID=UPI0034D34789